jgi:rhamnulokinase
MTVLAAVDLGAQSGRVAMGRFDGEVLELEELCRFPNEPVVVRGRLQWDVLSLYREVLAGLRLAARTGEPDAVAVDSWGVDFGLVDADGQLVANPVHYRDARRAAAYEQVLERIPARELYARTGIQLMPINTIFELGALAVAEDPALASARTLLLIPDLLQFWLCGRRVAELTNATTTQCYDPASGDWAVDLLARLDVPAEILPEIVPPASVLGRLSPEVADDTGAGAARVVAGATHDTGAAVAAIPFRRPGSAFLSVGTWSLVGVETNEPVTGEQAFAANVTNEGGVEGTVRVLRNVTGLWLLHECRRAWAAEGHEYTYGELVELAETAAPLRSLVDPNDVAFSEPGEMPRKIADACRASGQPEPAGPAETARCVLESLALKHAETVELVASVTGAVPAELHVVGGGARNELLCRWTAEATGLPVVVGPEEATVIGNLLVQAIALGELGSLAEAREVVRRSLPLRELEPTGAAEWQEARERFGGREPVEATR